MNKHGICKVITNISFYVLLLGLLSICLVDKLNIGYEFYSVLSNSMQPAISMGDLVVIKETLPKDIKKGDIITFGNEFTDSTTTHRVKDIVNENGEIEFITQGDANNTQDANSVNSEKLIGKVVVFIPILGGILIWTKSNLTSIMIIGLAILSIILIMKLTKRKLKQIDNEKSIHNV